MFPEPLEMGVIRIVSLHHLFTERFPVQIRQRHVSSILSLFAI